MQQQIAILKATRANILKQIEGVSLAQLNEIPAGFNNNLIWNAGHAVSYTHLTLPTIYSV